MNATATTTTFFRAATALIVSLLVSACGGGGDSQSQDDSNPGAGVPNTPAPSVPAGSPVLYAPGSSAAMALDMVNSAIARCGYNRMNPVLDLTTAAKAHANYEALNGYAIDHTEIPGRPGFTGVSHAERIVAAGGAAERANNASEGIGGFGGAHGRATTGLLAAPYHLATLLGGWSELGVGTTPDPSSAAFPAGVFSDTVVLVYGGNRLNTVPTNEVRTFPCEGSTLISSQGGPEKPDPAPELGGKFGPALNYETNKDGAIEVTSISLRNLATGDIVQVQQVKGHNLEGVAWRSMWISKGVLSRSTSYRVEARGNTYQTKSMTGSGTAWSKSYTFTTF